MRYAQFTSLALAGLFALSTAAPALAQDASNANTAVTTDSNTNAAATADANANANTTLICPQLVPYGPDFCIGGQITPGGTDAQGCPLAPKCVMSDQSTTADVVLAVPEVPAVTVPAEATLGPIASEPAAPPTLSTTNLDSAKNRAYAQIDRRVKDLGKFIANVGKLASTIRCVQAPCPSNGKITEGDAAALVSEAQGHIDALKALRTEIEGDTDAASLVEDFKRIYTEHRIYANILPKLHGLTQVAVLEKFIADKVAPALQKANEAVTSATSAGVNAASAQTTLTSGQTNLDQAKALLASAKEKFSGIQAAGYPGNLETIKSAQADLKQARKLIKDSTVKGLQKARAFAVKARQQAVKALQVKVKAERKAAQQKLKAEKKALQVKVKAEKKALQEKAKSERQAVQEKAKSERQSLQQKFKDAREQLKSRRQGAPANANSATGSTNVNSGDVNTNASTTNTNS